TAAGRSTGSTGMTPSPGPGGASSRSTPSTRSPRTAGWRRRPPDRFLSVVPESGYEKAENGILAPGQPSCMYHGEDEQEDFLILAGECLLLVEGQERRLKAWDFVHCPAWTEHVFVGAG